MGPAGLTLWPKTLSHHLQDQCSVWAAVWVPIALLQVQLPADAPESSTMWSRSLKSCTHMGNPGGVSGHWLQPGYKPNHRIISGEWISTYETLSHSTIQKNHNLNVGGLQASILSALFPATVYIQWAAFGMPELYRLLPSWWVRFDLKKKCILIQPKKLRPMYLVWCFLLNILVQ